jgi:hypothetical protein
MSTKAIRAEILSRITLDAKYSAFIDQQLEDVEAQVYHVLYPDLRARTFIPVNNSVSAGAETFSYFVWDMFGEACWLANYQNEIPTQALRGEKIVGKVEGMASAYSYSVQDLRAAAMANVGLDSELAKGAMLTLERKVDKHAALGDSARGFIGFVNHPNVDVLAATGSAGSWSNPATDPMLILADLQSLAKHVRSTTNEVFTPDTIVLPTDAHDAIATRLLNASNASGATILSAFLASNSWIKQVASWPKLTAAGVGATNRVVCYKKDSSVLDLVIPLEPLQHEPQQVQLNYQVIIELRFGGTRIRQPKAMVYMDGV